MDAGINLFRLQIFVAVVERGGFTAAAGHLDLSQPSVSFHIKALERIFGARLIQYRGRAIHLTPEGEELYRTAKVMLRDADNLLAGIRALQDGQRGRLRLGASIALEQACFFDQIIAPFSRAHPYVHLSLQFGHSARLAEAILGREIDLAYALNWRLPEGVHYEPLHSAELVLMVSRDHPLAGKEIVSAEEINLAGIIAAPEQGVDAAAYESAFRRAGLAGYRIAVEVDGIQARMLAARAGLGILTTFMPPYAGEDDGGGLRRVPLTGSPVTVEFGLISRAGHLWTPIMRSFAGLLRAVAGSGH